MTWRMITPLATRPLVREEDPLTMMRRSEIKAK
jgi:hypothetical protein